MCVLYLLSPGVRAGKNRGRVRILKNGQKLDSVLIRDVESVVVGRCAEISTELLFELMKLKRGIFYVDGMGRLIGQLGSENNSWERLSCQIRCFDDEKQAIELIRSVLNTKITEQMKLLKQYANKKGIVTLTAIADSLLIYRRKIRQENDCDALRGIEGIASRTYFEGFKYILDEKYWKWEGRNRRPSLDPVNALLNYGYAFLEREVRLGCIGSGLDVRLGFFHSNNGRKDSLVFDLMELFRQKIIDRLILKTLNRGQMWPNDFKMNDEEGCRLTEEGRNKWINIYENEMETVYSEFNGLSPRDYLRQHIRQFAIDIYRTAATSA